MLRRTHHASTVDAPHPVADVPVPLDALLTAYGVPAATSSTRPWIRLNLVASLDGRTAVFGRVGTLSVPADQALFHHLRGLADGILVGAATVRAERYGPVRISPEVRDERKARGQDPEPLLVIVSRSLELGSVIDQLGDRRPIVMTCDAAPAHLVVDLAPKIELISAGTDRVELPRALMALRRRGIRSLLCEGGPTLNGELLEQHLVDEVCITYAPFIGGDPIGMFTLGSAQLVNAHVTHAFHTGDAVFVRALLDAQSD
jgi:riboflavin-specific deaminase-like protein